MTLEIPQHLFIAIDHVGIAVPDLDEAKWTMKQRGVVFDGHESEVPGFARFATFHDPDGNAVQLIEYLR